MVATRDSSKKSEEETAEMESAEYKSRMGLSVVDSALKNVSIFEFEKELLLIEELV